MKYLRHLYISHRGRMFRVESDPMSHTTTLVLTTWEEEIAREAKTKEDM